MQISDSIKQPQASGAQPLSDEAFLALGVHYIAYMRPIMQNGRTGWGVYAADGSPLHMLDTDVRAVAQATVRQNDLVPVSVH